MCVVCDGMISTMYKKEKEKRKCKRKEREREREREGSHEKWVVEFQLLQIHTHSLTHSHTQKDISSFLSLFSRSASFHPNVTAPHSSIVTSGFILSTYSMPINAFKGVCDNTYLLCQRRYVVLYYFVCLSIPCT